jgi:hypothetical protein
MQLLWAKSMMNGDGMVVFIRCKVHSKVEGNENLFPKVDYLLSMQGRRK